MQMEVFWLVVVHILTLVYDVLLSIVLCFYETQHKNKENQKNRKRTCLLGKGPITYSEQFYTCFKRQ